jgi:hypothetical protein
VGAAATEGSSWARAPARVIRGGRARDADREVEVAGADVDAGVDVVDQVAHVDDIS